METLQIGSAVAKPGTRGNGYLKIASLSDGSPVSVPVIILQGTKPGPRLWVQSATHGDEITGSVGILQACRELDPNEMAGSLIGIPVFNITGFWSEKRTSPFTIHGTHEPDWVYPGKKTGNFTEIMVFCIFQAFVKNADYAIDFHCGKHEDTLWQVYWEDGSENAQKSQDLARAFGIEHVLRLYGTRDFTGGGESIYTKEAVSKFLIAEAAKHNIPSIIAEVGGKGTQTNSKGVSIAAEGILNIMKYLKILNKPFDISKKPVTFLKEWVMVGAPYGGRFVPTVEIRETVRKGQTIARIYTIFDDELDPIRSPIDGVILTFSREPFVNAGSYIFQIGTPE